MDYIKKIGLGTAQFGLDYGISNQKGKVPGEEVLKILDYAWDHSILCVDTSSAYGSSEVIIGEYQRTRQRTFDIISKFVVNDSDYDIRKDIDDQLCRLNVEALDGLLFHRFEDFKKNDGMLDQLEELKGQGKVRKTGFSLYHPEELEFLFEKNIRFDVIQIPYSVFDRRFEVYFEQLHRKGVDIYVRSVFLQGLVFLDITEMGSFFSDAEAPISILKELSREIGVSVHCLCLNFVLLNQYVHKTVIGAETRAMLSRNMESVQHIDDVKNVYARLDKVEIHNENILLPYKWMTEYAHTK